MKQYQRLPASSKTSTIDWKGLLIKIFHQSLGAFMCIIDMHFVYRKADEKFMNHESKFKNFSLLSPYWRERYIHEVFTVKEIFDHCHSLCNILVFYGLEARFCSLTFLSQLLSVTVSETKQKKNRSVSFHFFDRVIHGIISHISSHRVSSFAY